MYVCIKSQFSVNSNLEQPFASNSFAVINSSFYDRNTRSFYRWFPQYIIMLPKKTRLNVLFIPSILSSVLETLGLQKSTSNSYSAEGYSRDFLSKIWKN